MVYRRLSMSHNFVQQMIYGLLNDNSGRNRLSCAIDLMKVQEPQVKRAYIQALDDTFEEVVQLACFQLSHRGGIDTIEALYQALEHRSWHVRLEVCKALITLKSVDQRVVLALEQMVCEPEAIEYDSEYEELERLLGNPQFPNEWTELWGRMDTIIERARQIAAGLS